MANLKEKVTELEAENKELRSYLREVFEEQEEKVVS